MGLEFTHLPDRQGPAVYMLGTSMLETDLMALGKEIDHATPDAIQVVYLDVKGGDGARVADFYDITPEHLPAIMIVQDDDTLFQTWFGSQLPTADHIAHELRKITG